MKDLFKSFADELEERKLAKYDDDDNEKHRKVSELADVHTMADTGVDPANQKALSEYGENSWYAEHGHHEDRLHGLNDLEFHKEYTKVFGRKKRK